MTSKWTFGRKLAIGFGSLVLLVVLICGFAVFAIRTVTVEKDDVINVQAQNAIEVERARGALARAAVTMREYLLTGDEASLGALDAHRVEIERTLARLAEKIDDPDAAQQLEDVEALRHEYDSAQDANIAARRSGVPVDEVVAGMKTTTTPLRSRMDTALDRFADGIAVRLATRTQDATDGATSAVELVVGLAVLCGLLAASAAYLLTSTLNRQIGTSVGQVQSSATELQAVAHQQAAGAREQATAMNEVSTTITELLATSRQIAESAQHVAQMAEQTALAARSGDTTVASGHASISATRKQVDQIVSQMVELGRKSQQIGAVLDIVGELAEQTNILAINATIEAAGAGESGKRFAVVAEEIRKLADRVAASTKEVRSLIEDVRGSVNATVMTTETGSKAVDAGASQFNDVAAAFSRIGSLVGSTTEAAREIELSTKQQATAVEQVQLAVSDAAQATRETETSSSQTLQTASQLADLSRELQRLVRPDAA